jgi:hypothetical protein
MPLAILTLRQGSERPLVFVCHSLGGIIVQKVSATVAFNIMTVNPGQALLRAQMDSNHTRLRWATIGVVRAILAQPFSDWRLTRCNRFLFGPHIAAILTMGTTTLVASSGEDLEVIHLRPTRPTIGKLQRPLQRSTTIFGSSRLR